MNLRRCLGLALATAGALYAGFALGSPQVREGWFLGFVIIAGLTAASLGLLMIGHLLGDRWLAPIRDELEPVSWTMPVVVLLALPLSVGVDQLYPWVGSPELLPQARRSWFTVDWFFVRSALYLAVWSVLAWITTRAGPHPVGSFVGLLLLAATFSLASLDWVMSREPHWWSSLFGFAFAVSQLLAALAAAILITVARQSHPASEELESIERALLTLALLTAWVWFAQFLVVWMANLPSEARWYVDRMNGGWGWLKLAVIVPTLALAILLLLPSHARSQRVLAACALLLVHHVAHMVWLVRPVEHAPALAATDVVTALVIGGVWLLWFAAGLQRQARLEAARSRPGRTEC